MERIKKYRGLIVVMALIIVSEVLLGTGMLYKVDYSQENYNIENIDDYVGYKIDKDEFVMVDDDPQLFLKNKMENITGIKIQLSEPLQNETVCQVYYGQSPKLMKEDKSYSFNMESGKTSFEYNLLIPKAKLLRIDINQSFSLSNITVFSEITKLSTVRVMICLLLNLFLLVFVYIARDRIIALYNKCIDVVYNICKKTRIELEHVFLVLAIIMGVTFAFLIPPNQIPDEFTHISMMETEVGVTGYADEINEFYHQAGMPNFAGKIDEKVDRNVFNEHKSDHFVNGSGIVNRPSILIVKHLPAAIGFFMGVLFNLPIYTCFMMGEIGSVLFFAIMGYISIKFMPIKKELLCAVMLLPMTIQQCSSYNYDAVLLPCCFFLTAYILHFVYGNDSIQWRNLVLIFAVTGVIFLTKMLYVLLIVLLLLVPKQNWKLKIYRFDIVEWIHSHRIISIIIGCMIMCMGIYVIWDNLYVKLVRTCLGNPGHYAEVIINTLKTDCAFYYRTSLGVFGCLDTYANEIYYVLILCMLIVFSQAESKYLGKTKSINVLHRIICIFVGVFTILLIITTMVGWAFFLAGYPYETASMSELAQYFNMIDISVGTQGRYFIPLMVPILLALHGIMKIKRKNLIMIQIMYYPVIFVWSIYVIHNRFW